ncbi:nudix hydrolase 14 [Amniculicola lignicola CBS 123094]|uniref:Nudix hydrolase 14 n=1 Tax=Amniculicola lignicola CBS 123094 TaxID=1392246 RepID=A0A6A5W5J9_9PLEO|nr:nudix hydrolase 14 [Amniculicola lignicola CBS 123094]
MLHRLRLSALHPTILTITKPASPILRAGYSVQKMPSNNISSSSSTSGTSFILQNSEPECKVLLPQNLAQDQLLNFPAFKNWISTLQHSLSLQKQESHAFHKDPYKLRKVDIQAVDWFTKTKLGFVKIQAEVTTDRGDWLPGAVFLRGGSVGMLIVLQPNTAPPNTEQDKHVLLTIQPRIAAGSLALAELPAGMLDDGTFAGKAAEEIREETGLTVPENELINMSDIALSNMSSSTSPSDEEKLQNAVYPSPGACDEFIPLFLYQKRIDPKELEDLSGKLTGLRHEGEKITLKLVKLEDLWKEGGRDAKALAALTLYEGLRREGKI